MSADTSRRGFLRGLAALPMIGGGVTLIGQPTAAAVPVTMPLYERYLAWIAAEHAEALVHYEKLRHPDRPFHAEYRREWVRQPLYWFPDDPVARASVLGSSPSTRAAVVLSAVGCALPEA